jgi:regulator of sirC expression with transglutaminase-like and TPR domain
VRSQQIAEELQRALSAPGEQIAPAALAIARLEHPHLDPRPLLEQIEAFGHDAARRLEGVAPVRARITAVNQYIFGTLGFTANREQYLDPRNNFLNVVLERRTGIPITLSIVYIEIGRRAGLELDGIGFPGHFLVRAAGEEPGDDHAIILDPFNGGTLLSEFDCISLLREHAGEDAAWDPGLLGATTRHAIAVRLLSNLKRAYVALRSYSHARRVSDLLVALDPSAITELRDRGLLSYHLEDFSAALRDLEKYLAAMPHGAPNAASARDRSSEPSTREDADVPDVSQADEDASEESRTIWEHVKSLRRRVASLN